MSMNKRHELEEKTERVVGFLSAEGLGGVLLGAQHNFSWLTCGGTNGIDLSRESGAGALMVRRDGQRFVLANRIEMARLLAEELSEQDWEPVEFGWEEEKANPSFVADRARTLLAGGAALGSDLDVAGSARVVEGAFAYLRYKLTDSEIERFRALGRDAGEVIGAMARTLLPGLTEQEIARRTSDALAAYGAYSVVTLVAGDERLSSYRHPVPTARRWEKVVMIAVCARRAGLIASLTRIVCAGAVPDRLRHRTQLAARVNAQLFSATRPGVSGRELYEVAARAYRDVGFAGEELLHHQGGAAGYRTRDWVAHPYCQQKVMTRQAFAWNPSITGTKVEETCIAGGGAVEVITATPNWPSIPFEVDGCQYLLPDVLSL
jgi:Xaa-Pro aminopeptidase